MRHKLNNLLVDKAISLVKTIQDKDTSGHDTFHVLSVYNNALKLAESYDVNIDIIALASLLHDLDDPKISQGTSYAMDFLDEYAPNLKDKTMDIINNMSFSSHIEGKKVSSLEGLIVQDADRLDALGAIGIARCFAYGGYAKRPIFKGDKDDDSAIAHFYQKLLKLPDLMNTIEARIIANERVEFMKEYLKEFFQEWDV